MRRYDQHLHSIHSFDSAADPADNVRAALDRGLAGLTFTEHYDTHPEEIEGCVYAHAAYTETIRRLRDRFGDRIFIGQGVEIDYQPENLPRIADFVGQGGFDLVMLSVHWCDGRPIHHRDVWTGNDPNELTRRYLLGVRDAMRRCVELHAGGERVFDVLGHLDFAKRYAHRFGGGVFVEHHMDVIDEILQAAMAADIVPEINTSTLRRGIDEPMPGPSVIRRYAELGGTAMTIGSDSHRSEEIGAGFDEAVDLMRRAGLDNLAVFEKRRRRGEPLDSLPQSSSLST